MPRELFTDTTQQKAYIVMDKARGINLNDFVIENQSKIEAIFEGKVEGNIKDISEQGFDDKPLSGLTED